MPSSTLERGNSTKATAKASVFQRDAVSRFMTALHRMSHRLSEVTKKMPAARPPPNALRINSLQVTDGSATEEMRPVIGAVRDAGGPRETDRGREKA
ncbi:uncharacterized [Tachysurus ichikawai]